MARIEELTNGRGTSRMETIRIRFWTAFSVLFFLNFVQSNMFFAFSHTRYCRRLVRSPTFTHAFRVTPACGLQVTIHIRGKRSGGEEFLNDAYLEYTKRLRPVLGLTTVWHKTDSELEAAIAKEKAPVICLDEGGKQLSSMELADILYKRLEEGGARLSLVIGGAEGLPPRLRASKELWSLSRLTFTHQWARVLLAEQIYRASEIKRGSGYHKE